MSTSKSLVGFCLLALLALLPSTALADVIHLETGGKYRGKIIKETASSVTIKTSSGKIRVLKRDIQRIVKEDDLADEFKKRWDKAKKRADVERWCTLGAWAREKELKKEAVRCFEQALELKPNHEPAREALGHKLHKGRWYDRDAYNSEVLGLVRYKGKWVTPAEKTNREAGLVLRDGKWVNPKAKTPKKPKAKKPKRDKKRDRKTYGKGAKFEAMSFNIRYDFKNDGRNRWPNRVEAVAKVIKRADVIGIQEDKRGQVEDLKPLLPGYEIVGSGRNATGSGERCSILVKRKAGKIKDWGEFWLSDTPDVKGSNTWRDRYPRKVTWALIELKGARTRLLLLNTHLPEKDKGRDPENRVKGMKVMNEFLQKRLPKKERKNVSILCTGDYNSGPDEEPRKVLVGSGDTATGLKDAWNETKVRPPFSGTFNGFSGRRGRHRIDWLLVGGPVKVHRYRTFAEKVDGRWPSDHYPITVTLELR